MSLLPKVLPTALPDRDDVPLPTTQELFHWSARLTHAAVIAGVAVGLALALHAILFLLLRRLSRHSDSARIDRIVAARLNQSTRWWLVAVALSIVDESDPLLTKIWTPAARFIEPALMGWMVFAAVKAMAHVLAARISPDEDELAARSRRTRIALISRSISFLVVLFTVALILLGFPGVSHIGATLLASASIVGIAVGAAAQPALKSLIAGVQIALTEPVRIGDFVVMDGENGRVEDIRLSYVVIRTADERRVIVPTIKFLDSSFQNWTRVGGIAGTVVLPIRPGFAIAPIRAAYLAALAKAPQWDQRSGALIVSEARVGSVELKLMMSAREPGALAELRLAMREAMLEWLREEMPDSLCTAP